MFDDNNSFFSTPSYKQYLNSDRPITNSVDNHRNLSPDSLCGPSPFEMAGGTNGVDVDKCVVKDITNTSVANDTLGYTSTVSSNYIHNPPRQMSMLNDFMPLNSSEDWQAAFGFPNSTHNQAEQRLFPTDSSRTLNHISNGVNHANLQDFQGLQHNGMYMICQNHFFVFIFSFNVFQVII